jgi:hypothetical protein
MPAQFVYAPMQIDHIVPSSKGGTDAENNLWLACPRCNNFKGDQAEAIDPDTGDRVGLFNPRLQHWSDHFVWGGDEATLIIGLTPTGRATAIVLQLNNEKSVRFRRKLVSVGWHPPGD